MNPTLDPPTRAIMATPADAGYVVTLGHDDAGAIIAEARDDTGEVWHVRAVSAYRGVRG